MKAIDCFGGDVALVDDEDFVKLAQYKWVKNPSGHVVRYVKSGSKLTAILMHREILGAPDDKEIDHINGKAYDNRRANLRLCTHAENMKNRKRHKNNTSGYKGVWLRKATGKWEAAIRNDGKKVHIGTFANKLEAASAYNRAAIRLHGEFARINPL